MLESMRHIDLVNHDIMTSMGQVMLDSCIALLNGEAAYFYKKCEVDTILDAIAMPLKVSPLLDDDKTTYGWEIQLIKE